mmetsp:Transcript_8015/g.28164  ORF Transcript_8015/g.28164 Transcript_8015/m.28164 type:complete len:208 (-) Transcript_8015:835-1458(-)
MSIAPMLRRALVNEKHAPEILPYEDTLISQLRLRMCQVEAVAAEYAHDSRDIFRVLTSVVRSDLNRMRYIVRGYLRVRLNKIEANCTYYMLHTGFYNRLSTFEKQYAKTHIQLVETKMYQSVLYELPKTYHSILQTVDEGTSCVNGPGTNFDMISPPRKEAYVFITVLKGCSLDIGEDMQVLSQGDLCVTHFCHISEILQQVFVALS